MLLMTSSLSYTGLLLLYFRLLFSSIIYATDIVDTITFSLILLFYLFISILNINLMLALSIFAFLN